ncbi:prolyl oligopeptidase family serine peptidase [Spongiimicrobium sp. 3-5]|uniref:prolyl oligopeptidase family serine peptidase n=1 Tax=Spongiimicrobium sp. 3-5 TaxID=3332596 RepID=UPI00397F1C8E
MKIPKFVILTVLLCMGITNLFAQEHAYVCPPCASDCHKEEYKNPGKCPTCNMDLEQREELSVAGFTANKVKIKSGDIYLNAAYVTPKDIQKPNAVVVIVHGSAPSRYTDVGYYISLATKMGMSVLAIDKRGVGGSGGVYEFFTVERSAAWFQLLAEDVVACLKWLGKQPSVDPARIGLLGGSQAGWIMPLAASMDKSVKFIIVGEGVSVSAGEEDYFSALSGDGTEEGISLEEADEKLKQFKGDRGFDPRGILKKLNAKTLWIFGTSDPVIPVNASLRELEKIDNDDYEVVILPHGDHNFYNTKTEVRYNLVDYIMPWLVKHGFIKD